MLIVNDIHIGVERMAGTTPTSAQALRGYLLQTYAELITGHDEVLVNGDLFDTYNIPLTDLLQAYQISATWLDASQRRKLHLIPGNHCLSKNSMNLSSFELMARLLQARFGDRVTYTQGGAWVDEERGLYAISHVVNQDLLDYEISRVPHEAKYVFLHANFSNTFAVNSDHSLNVTREQVRDLISRGSTVVFGHEHQGRTLFSGRLVITGNPRPSSVADCLAHGDGQLDGKKWAMVISPTGDYSMLQTWDRKDPIYGYDEIDWRDLSGLTESRKFVRVTGEAEADEAADVIKAIASFRQRSDAFVITNAVKVSQLADTGELEVSAEDVRSVNVIDMLLQSLTEEQAATVRQLMEKNK